MPLRSRLSLNMKYTWALLIAKKVSGTNFFARISLIDFDSQCAKEAVRIRKSCRGRIK